MAGPTTGDAPRELSYYCGCLGCREQVKRRLRDNLFVSQSTWYLHRKAREWEIADNKILRPLPGTIEAIAPHKARKSLKRRRTNNTVPDEPVEKRACPSGVPPLSSAAGASGQSSTSGTDARQTRDTRGIVSYSLRCCVCTALRSRYPQGDVRQLP